MHRGRLIIQSQEVLCPKRMMWPSGHATSISLTCDSLLSGLVRIFAPLSLMSS